MAAGANERGHGVDEPGLLATVDAADSSAPTVDPTMTNPHAEPRGATSPGVFIGRYEIGALLGSGGMGVVHRATDPDLKRPLAIKLVRHAGGSVGQARVLREAQAMARLRHPNVVPVFDVGTYEGRVYLVMPLLEGGTLGAWMRAETRPWPAVLSRFLAAARGLAAAHAVGLVHRDFKPDNVLIGADDEIQVADFGLARIDRDDAAPSATPLGSSVGGTAITQAGEIMGTPAYMAPEQLDGAVVDAAADQFAFSVALHEALYGQRPFGVAKGVSSDVSAIASLRDAIRRSDLRTPTAGRDVPRWLRNAVVRGLREAPAQRWPSMAALIAELERHLHQPRRRAVLALGVAGAAALGVVGWTAMRRDSTRSTPPPPTATAPAPRSWTETPLTFRGDLVDAALSPDGKTIAAVAGRDLVTVPVEGGPPRTVVRNVTDQENTRPQWSPDGKQLLVYGGSRYQLVDLATGMTTPLPSLGGFPYFVTPTELVTAFTPQKRLIFYDLQKQSYTRSCDVPGDYRWVHSVHAAAGAIFMSVAYENGNSALYVTNSACFLPRVLVPPNDAFKYLPGADGRIFATRQPHKVEVQEYDADGRAHGTPRALPAGVLDVIAVRSDDSVVLQRTVMSWRLFQLDRDASKDVARGSMFPQIVIAPDGHRVALVERLPGQEGVLYLVDLEAVDDRSHRLLDGVSAVAWSPDGTRLAAVRSDATARLVEIDVATGSVHELAADDVSVQSNPTWLDDRRVAYLRTDHQAYRWIDRVDGKRGDLLDDKPGWTFQLTASRADGTLALFWSRADRGLWLAPPTGKPYKVREGEGLIFEWSPDGRTLWIADGNRIERFDPRTKKLSLFRVIDIDPNVHIYGLFPTGPETILLQTSSSVSDLALLAPE